MLNKNYPNYDKTPIKVEVLKGQKDAEGNLINEIYTYTVGGNRVSRRKNK